MGQRHNSFNGTPSLTLHPISLTKHAGRSVCDIVQMHKTHPTP